MDIRALNSAEQEALDQALDFYRDLSVRTNRPPEEIGTLQSFVDEAQSGSSFPEIALISFGLAFGQFVHHACQLEWVRASAESGEETALCHPSAKLVVYPISALQKRLLSPEAVDVAHLRDALCAAVEERFESGEYQAR